MLRLILLALALPLAADGTADLRTTLQRLRGREPVKATLHVNRWQRTVEDKQPREQTAQGDFLVTDGPAGFGFGVQAATAERVRAEAQKPVPRDKKQRPGLTPVTELVASIGMLDAAELVNAAESLLSLLQDATLKEDRLDESPGLKGRLLGFELPTEEESKMGAKAKVTGFLKVWLGPDGLPFASQRTQGFEGGFMWIKAKSEESISRRYLAEGGRLLVAEDTRENRMEGAGDRVQVKRTLKLTPLREPAR